MDTYNITKLLDTTISPQTMKTYINILNNLLKNMSIKKRNITSNFFISNSEEIIDYIKKNIDNIGSQNTYISSILNIINNDKKLKDKYNNIEDNYRNLLLENRQNINLKKNNNEKNIKEIENWISYNDILNKYNDLEKEYMKYLDNPEKYKVKDLLFNKIQNYVLLSFYVLLEPRRLEYTTLKYKNYDKNLDNYYNISTKEIILNNYKTSKYKKDYIIDLSNNKLSTIINKFINLKSYININSDYLFTSINNNPLDNSQITKRLNNIFDGKKVSVSMIRKIYLTYNYGDNLDTLKNIINTSKNMGNSVNVITQHYLKK